MKIMKLLLVVAVGAFLFLGGMTSYAQENLIKNGDAETGNITNWSKTVKLSEGSPHGGNYCFKVLNQKSPRSSQLIPIEEGKTYTLTGWFKSTGAIKSKIYFGYAPYDENKQPISAFHVTVYPKSETTLVEACKKGDRILKIKNGKGWKVYKYGRVAFEVDGSGKYSDLPNRNLSPYGIKEVVAKEDFWEVHLARPCGKEYPEGTLVREHIGGSGYIYKVSSGKKGVPDEWTKYTGIIKEWSKHGCSGTKWWAGTKYVKILVLARPKKDAELLFDDIILTASEQLL